MNTFKNLLIYSVSLVFLFSLTAISCDETEDLLDIDIPTTIDESFVITTTEAKDTTFTETVNPTSEEIEEYKDRVKSISAEKLTIYVSDNGSNGNTGSGELILDFGPGQRFPLKSVSDINDLDELEIDLTTSNLEDLQSAIIAELEAGNTFDVNFALSSDGAIDYTIRIVIEGVITASPTSSN